MTLPGLPESPYILRGATDGPLTLELTDDHRYRLKALAVPGAYWSRERGAYAVDNPTPRAAAAIIALFPEALVDHPDLTQIRDRDYGNARPHDFAGELGLRLEVGKLGDKTPYDWQDIDGGYLAAILRRDRGAFVGWDRGLGKTLITAAFIKKLGAARSLVVARNDAKDPVWRVQLEELLPDHEILVLPNEAKKRNQLLEWLRLEWYDRQHADEEGAPPLRPLILVIHYEAIAVIAGSKAVKHSDGTETVTKAGGNGWSGLGQWDLMAFDEGHRLASYNPNSKKNTQMGKALSKLRSKHVDMALNLTGSSIMNRPDDLFGQLHFLYPKIYRAKWADWNDRYIDYVDDGNRKVAIGFKTEKLDELRRELGVFMVYRTKAEVFKSLPPLIQQDIELDMHPEQWRVYKDVRDQFWAKIEEGGIKAVNPLSQMNLLRRIATYYPGVPSAKLDFALNELKEEPDEQFVVFTWFKEPGRALAEKLGEEEVVVVDGDVPIKQRVHLLDRHKRGHARVLVGSIATLGESLNLQYVSEAIRLDRDWNPQANAQTTDRLYRNGQQSPVTFRDLWSKGTVDTLRVRPNLASKESMRKAVFG